MVKPLLVEAPGKIVPNVWILHPMTGQEAVRWTVFGVSITDTGHGFVGMAKLFEYSLTIVMSKERKMRMIRSVPKRQAGKL